MTAVQDEHGNPLQGFVEIGDARTEVDAERCLQLAETFSRLAIGLLRAESAESMAKLAESVAELARRAEEWR